MSIEISIQLTLISSLFFFRRVCQILQVHSKYGSLIVMLNDNSNCSSFVSIQPNGKNIGFIIFSIDFYFDFCDLSIFINNVSAVGYVCIVAEPQLTVKYIHTALALVCMLLL